MFFDVYLILKIFLQHADESEKLLISRLSKKCYQELVPQSMRPVPLNKVRINFSLFLLTSKDLMTQEQRVMI